jgi:thioester reductase-like protein
VLARLRQHRVPHRLLRGNIAFHSRAMDVIEADLRASLAFLDGPHLALTPAVRQCLAGRDRPPACVRTLGRDEDPRLAWHQALGALYRAGVPLDFAARYPRVRPVSHLLPPHPGTGAAPGPALAAALPGPCREDLELLLDSIREFTGGRPGGPPVPADQFGAVFLTGATGFAGRFVLSELLRHNDHMLVHCLVRAQNAKQALARVQAALEAAGRWDDYLADRIRAWPGDLREPRFGLPELDFRRLCGQVDAVYHLAADSDLRLPYAALREASTRGFRTVLELALRRRAKHVFYASAMGVFPQYFCDFAHDFAGHVIEDGDQPDPGLMQSVFPPDVMGYPWAKLVAEQALLSAPSAVLPSAIMRLPRMGIAAATSYPHGSDIRLRIAMAAVGAGVMPSGFRLPRTEPVQTVSETLTAISRDPRRRRTLCHLCPPEPRTPAPELAGSSPREVSYADFKRACQACGPDGPLHGYWPLLDRFAAYWFSGAPPG